MRNPVVAVPVLLSLSSFVLVACDPEIPREERPTYVVAEFDPSAPEPVAPRPNDLAISDETGLVSFEDASSSSDAERAFNRYLRTLDGFPTAATATVSFSAPLDPASVTLDALRVIDVTDPAAPTVLTADLSISWNETKRRVEVRGPWLKARRYAVALIAGETGLRARDGRAVVAAPAFLLTRTRESLVTCTDLSSRSCAPTTALITGASTAELRTRAVAMERARLKLQPALELLESQGIPREQLAAAWTFTTVSMPLVTFDPAKKVIPFPNDLLMKDGHVNLPIDPEDDAQTIALKNMLNTLAGFSTTASLLTEAGDDVGALDERIDAASLAGTQFLLIDRFRFDPAKNQYETITVEVTCRACGSGASSPGAEPDQIALKPSKPLRGSTSYAVVWLKGAKGLSGRAVNTGSVFALMRLPTPLVENGKSRIDGVDDLTAALVEPLREQTQNVMWYVDQRKIPREDVLLGWTFVTQPTSNELVYLPHNLNEYWKPPTGIVGGPAALTDVSLAQLAQVSQFTGRDFHSHLQWAKEGELTSLNLLEPDATEVLPNGQSVPTLGAFSFSQMREERLKFLLTAPKISKYADGRVPVIVFQHGLGRWRRDAGLIANTIAKHGYAMLAIDAPMHGDRSFCQSDAQCVSGTQCVNHQCPGGYVPGDLTGTPAISGQQFVSIGNPFFTRDHFRQQVIDLAQLIRVLKDTTSGIGAVDVDNPETPTVVERLDVNGVGYVGQSLGGIIGALATATLPDIHSATLNVPGASQTDIVLRASAFEMQKMALDASLAARGIQPGSQAYEAFLDTARWAMDPADPQNFGRHFIDEPLIDPSKFPAQVVMPRKAVFVSWIDGDAVVPNYCTELLLRSIEAKSFPTLFKSTKYEGGDHSFLLNIQNAPFALQAQQDAVDWVDRHGEF